MPILLDTPVNTGDLDPSVMDHCKMQMQTHDGRRLTIGMDLEYGTIVDGAWVAGKTIPAPDSAYPNTDTISGDDYASVINDSTPDVQTSDPSDPKYTKVGDVWVEKTYYASKRGLYEWLQGKHAALAGTIV